MIFRKFSFIAVIIFIVLCASSALAHWDYSVQDTAGEKAKIDLENSSVCIDYETQEITLPKAMDNLPNIIDIAEEGYDYVVATKDGVKRYMFDGEGMSEVSILNIPEQGPLGVAMTSLTPDVMVSFAGESGTNIEHYSFDGSQMVKTPGYELAGLQYGFSMGVIRDTNELAVLEDGRVETYGYDGGSLISIPYLSTSALESPLALAVANDYNIAVLEPAGVKWYMFDGSQMINVPALSVSENFSEPKSISIRQGEMAVLDDDEILFYKFNPTTGAMERHTYFTSTTNFTGPRSMAFKQGTKDMVIVDSPQEEGQPFSVRYFAFDGSQLVEIDSLGVQVHDIVGSGYPSQGELISEAVSLEESLDMFRVRAYTDLPENTSIEWYVSSGGAWHPSWRAINEGEIKIEKWLPDIIEGEFDFGTGNWYNYGDLEHSYPTFDSFEIDVEYEINPEDGTIEYKEPLLMQMLLADLWSYLPEGDSFKWKAVLKTEDPLATPKIYQPNPTNNDKGLIDNIAVKWDAAKKIPVIEPIIEDDEDNYHGDPEQFEPWEGWIYTTTPLFKWNFGEEEITQTAFQLILTANKNGVWEVILDTGKTLTVDTEFQIPTSYDTTLSGPMWSADTYEFGVYVRIWDTTDTPTGFSEIKQFKVLAFERPRIAELATLPGSFEDVYEAVPELKDDSTHYMITPNMLVEDLPIVHAGSQVTLLLDSVGPINDIAEDVAYFYIDNEGEEIELSLGDCQRLNSAGANNNRWVFNFWTEAPISEVPDGTVIKAKFIGEGTEGGTTVFYIPLYAEGIAVTEGTVYETWDVVLQGSDR